MDKQLLQLVRNAAVAAGYEVIEHPDGGLLVKDPGPLGARAEVMVRPLPAQVAPPVMPAVAMPPVA